MKNYFRVSVFTLLGLFAVTSFNTLQATPLAPSDTLKATPLAPSVKNLDRFSQALVRALRHENEGVQLSALRQVINYGSDVDVSDAIFDIVAIYRSNENENVRILALSAIASTKHSWAMDFLKRSVVFESSERVERHTRAALKG